MCRKVPNAARRQKKPPPRRERGGGGVGNRKRVRSNRAGRHQRPPRASIGRQTLSAKHPVPESFRPALTRRTRRYYLNFASRPADRSSDVRLDEPTSSKSSSDVIFRGLAEAASFGDLDDGPTRSVLSAVSDCPMYEIRRLSRRQKVPKKSVIGDARPGRS